MGQMKIRYISVLLLSSLLAAVSSSASSSVDDDFDLFLFVQQCPGSLCDSKKGCCFQDTGKPAPEFGIHGLWPQYATCSRMASHALVEICPGFEVAANVFQTPNTCIMQWPGSLCDSKKGCCFQDTGKPAPEFGIHGLWPQYATCRPAAAGDDGAASAFNILGSSSTAAGKTKKKCWPEDCGDKKDKLDLLQIKDLLAALERDWPTLSCKNGATNMDFWGHEWEKHGTCSAFDQHRYFQRSLELKAAHNLTAVLAEAGIVPSDSATYFLSGVKDVIRGATGSDAIVECNRNTAGEAQLYQVYLCVAPDGSGLVDCPEPLLRNCADKIKFPAF